MGEPSITESQSSRSSLNLHDDAPIVDAAAIVNVGDAPVVDAAAIVNVDDASGVDAAAIVNVDDAPVVDAAPIVNVDDEIQINLKVRRNLNFKVKRSQTVKKIKELFCSKEGMFESLQELSFCGENLEDGHTLAECGINRNSSVDIFLDTVSHSVRKLIIKMAVNKHSIVIYANVKDTIQQIKSVVQAKEGIASDYFNLMHNGKLLESYQTLASLGIGDGSVFYLVNRPRDKLSVSVLTPTHGKIDLEVQHLQKIGNLKDLIGIMTDTQVFNVSLVHEGEVLKDSRTFKSYDFEENTLLELVYPFEILVKLWDGATIPLDVFPYDKVSKVNAEAFKRLGLDGYSGPSLIDGKMVDEDRTLESYGFQKGLILEIGCPKELAKTTS